MIRIEDMSFNYENGKKVLNNINLTIDSGEVICLTGASGSGKTTVTRILNGTIPHLYQGNIEGNVHINGEDIRQQSIYEISKISGSVFQNPRSQFFCLNTTSELAFEPENYGVDPQHIEVNINHSVEVLKMNHLLDRNIFDLSGGEKQLIACTAIQVSGHDIIILDEPSSNLDFATITKLRQLLKRWKNEGKTIIIAEHRLHYLVDVVDRFVVMKQGEISTVYDNITFNALSSDTLRDLGLRAIHLNHMKPKTSNYTNIEEKIALQNFMFNYKAKQPYALNIPKVELTKGKVTAIIGRNGSGKSTFARCLTGVERKFKGHVELDGRTLKRNQRLNHIYMVFQDVNNQLFAESVADELRLNHNQLDDASIQSRLQQYGISEHIDRHPLSLSGGEKQRLGIASAIETKREVLIFDEPSSGLDGQRMRDMSHILNRLASQGYTILLITHDYELLMSCADEVLYLENGCVKDQYQMDNEHLDDLQNFFEI
ncbi:ABC transporter ATP-binding protein [Staphylococcus shinii]|uniref:ABC transporter ATP-binding protein n=1 Tax=Staphylococcus shinii TaxID=2912228 RepID=UPI000D1ED7E6|nr:ABC transporter ATP-binding protein [Staphylococcus shinii]PTI03999.1 ABC transporter [Staphylococcus shinii]RIM96640.1 ATP-binding cassette domain-containing protein [Staphylococcus shinii]